MPIHLKEILYSLAAIAFLYGLFLYSKFVWKDHSYQKKLRVCGFDEAYTSIIKSIRNCTTEAELEAIYSNIYNFKLSFTNIVDDVALSHHVKHLYDKYYQKKFKLDKNEFASTQLAENEDSLEHLGEEASVFYMASNR